MGRVGGVKENGVGVKRASYVFDTAGMKLGTDACLLNHQRMSRVSLLMPQILAQLDPRMLMSLMGTDIKLPPKPPASLVRQVYNTRQQARQRALQQRRQQEMELFRRLKAMTPAELKAFQDRLSPTQLQQLVGRLKYLKQQDAPPTASDGPNMILSGANTVRRPSAQAAIAAARRRQASRRPKNPIDAIRKYQSYRKKAASALAAGCTSPMGLDSMDTFFAFNSGGCRRGGMGVCVMTGQSCVDIGSSIMCCPPGYTTGTVDMFGYMRQMQQFMAQFS
ncbi:hypothetical protein V1264_024992 [Littorina saxatilis]